MERRIHVTRWTFFAILVVALIILFTNPSQGTKTIAIYGMYAGAIVTIASYIWPWLVATAHVLRDTEVRPYRRQLFTILGWHAFLMASILVWIGTILSFIPLFWDRVFDVHSSGAQAGALGAIIGMLPMSVIQDMTPLFNAIRKSAATSTAPAEITYDLNRKLQSTRTMAWWFFPPTLICFFLPRTAIRLARGME